MRWAASASACVLAALCGVSARGVGAAAAPAAGPGAAATLMRLWAGIHDTDEQVVYAGDGPVAARHAVRRVRTLVAPVKLPWLGRHVLYLEEFPQGDPGHPRRQVLLRLRAEPGSAAVRISQYTFRHPERWWRRYRNPAQLRTLRHEDLATIPGCDLVLRRVGGQFRGGTDGDGCVDPGHPGRHVDYRLLVGRGLYWSRKRLLRSSDDRLLRQVDAYDHFELHQARLFVCRVRGSGGGAAGRRPLVSVDLSDRGGRARFTAPDGREYLLQLYNGDWPFDVDRDALILLLRRPGAAAPLAGSWAPRDSGEIRIDRGGLRVSCGSLVPDDDGVIA